MATEQLPPQLERHLVTFTVGSTGVEFRNPYGLRWWTSLFFRFFQELQLDKSFYGRYYIACSDGLGDRLYRLTRQLGVPVLTVCKQRHHEGVFLLPMPSLLRPKRWADLQMLRAYPRTRAVRSATMANCR